MYTHWVLYYLTATSDHLHCLAREAPLVWSSNLGSWHNSFPERLNSWPYVPIAILNEDVLLFPLYATEAQKQWLTAHWRGEILSLWPQTLLVSWLVAWTGTFSAEECFRQRNSTAAASRSQFSAKNFSRIMFLLDTSDCLALDLSMPGCPQSGSKRESGKHTHPKLESGVYWCWPKMDMRYLTAI